MTTQPTPVKAIEYDRETRDFALYLDGELVGFARSYQDGETVLDDLITRRAQRSGLGTPTTTTSDDPNALVAEAVQRQYEPTREEEAEVADWLDALEAEVAETRARDSYPAPVFVAASPVRYFLPPAELVAECLAALRRTAEGATARALDKAAYEVARGAYGLTLVDGSGALLVPSRTTGGVIYRVTQDGCSCPAGEAGKLCHHAALHEAVLLARDIRAAELDDEAGRVALAA